MSKKNKNGDDEGTGDAESAKGGKVKRGVDGPAHPESSNRGGIFQDAKGNIVQDSPNQRRN